MDIEVTLRNYRCFGNEPVSIRIKDGFTALVGTNNSGKSSLLRMPHELRPLFSILTTITSNPSQQLLYGTNAQGVWAPNVGPGERVFRTGANRPVEVEIIVRDGPAGQFALNGNQLCFAVTYGRQSVTSTTLKDEDGTVIASAEQPLSRPDPPAVDFAPFTSAMQELARAMYVGPFRNAINIGGRGSYYDIQVGQEFIRAFAAYKSGPQPDQNEAVYNLTQ
jgi:hypothetical protein